MTDISLIDQAIEYLKAIPPKIKDSEQSAETTKKNKDQEAFEKAHVTEVAKLNIVNGPAVEQVQHVVRMLAAYAEDKSDRKPISIGIFGPPGSGKSTFVENITENVKDLELAKTINLTQVTSPEELAEAFRSVLIAKRGGSGIPLIFFDEFDTMRDGTPLGWLSWFLAPMQDGQVLTGGQEIDIGKAVFVFAGGTAETLEEFSLSAQADPESYRARKVPDFVSRLSGAIDIAGVNGHGDDRIVRRAFALSYHLDSESFELIGEQRIRSLLVNGYFVHGARSIKTFLKSELAASKSAGGQAGPQKRTGDVAAAARLPNAIQRQHFSLGEFDGLTVGISAGLDDENSGNLSEELTKNLLRSGATVAYAGAFFPEGTLSKIVEQAKQAPSDLISDHAKRVRVVNYLGNVTRKEPKDFDDAVFELRQLQTISKRELVGLGAPEEGLFSAIPEGGRTYELGHHLAWAISQFRLRLRFVQDVSALVVYSGKDDGRSWGRMSGIAEEVMLALALKKPVFVMGGVGGAARHVGQLLGLSDKRVATAGILRPFEDISFYKGLERHAAEFEIPGIPNSPKSIDQVSAFLFHHGVCTSNWPANGLSIEENRALFADDFSNGVDGAVELIFRGLNRIS